MQHKSWIIIFPVLAFLAWNCLNHACFPGYDNRIFASVGISLLDGKALYADAWDSKPPVIHFLNALAMGVGGRTYGAIRVMERLFAVTGAVLMFLIVLRAFRSAWIGAAASAFYLAILFNPLAFEGGNLTEEYGSTNPLPMKGCRCRNENLRFQYS